MATLNLVVTPPAQARRGSSSADDNIVKAMQAQASEGVWVTDGTVYATHAEASNASQVYRRALAQALDLGSHQVKSRVWGQKGDTIITDRSAKGDWRFALTPDPSRVKRERNKEQTAE